jgi:hypothetical protein
VDKTRRTLYFSDESSCNQHAHGSCEHSQRESVGNRISRKDAESAGKPLNDEDLVQYILVGLGEDYDSVVNSVLVHSQAITVSELASQMLAFESHVDLCSGSSRSSANFTKR